MNCWPTPLFTIEFIERPERVRTRRIGLGFFRVGDGLSKELAACRVSCEPERNGSIQDLTMSDQLLFSLGHLL